MGTEFDIDFNWVGEKLIITDSSIDVQKLNGSNPLRVSAEEISINITIPSASFSGLDFPYYSFSNTTEKRIDSNITQAPLNGSVTVNVASCLVLENVTYESHTQTFTKAYAASEITCSLNDLTVDIEGIENTTTSNVLFIKYFEPPFQNLCFNGSIGVGIVHAETNFPAGQGETAINETVPTSINIITDFITGGANEVEFSIIHDDGTHVQTDTYSRSGISNVEFETLNINRLQFDVPRDTQYTVIVNATNSTAGTSCSTNYTFATNRGADNSVRQTGIALIGITLISIIVLIAGGILLL